MSEARSVILSRIKRALSNADLPDIGGPVGSPPQPPPFDQPLIDVFVDALKAVQAKAHIVEDKGEAIAFLLTQLRERGVSVVLGWNASALVPPGLVDALVKNDIVLVESHLQRTKRQALFQQWSDIEIGITGAQAGLARTGSIALFSDVNQGRLPSLMPPTHYAFLYADDIYPDLAAWIAGAGASIAHNSNTIVITGPSRSADIAQTLTLGAHGPRELHVIIIRS